MYRSHTCGELRPGHAGHEVTLAGWVHRRRDHGPLIFIDLRDRYGITQVVFDAALDGAAHTIASEVRSEYVVQVRGTVQVRPDEAHNPEIGTGAIEVRASGAVILNPARQPPLYISRDGNEEEALRLRYRYLDLRRSRMQRNIIMRHQIVKFIRDFLDHEGFLEIETPILMKSTPEGARDYLVPSRVHPGEFYALPQSPQQLKQLLMVAGFDRYFQIARCFRDEDQRADRQPEFTQLDLEMSFVDQEDVLTLMERLFVALAAAVVPHKRVATPFPRLTYAEALARYGSDKPDLRYGLAFTDLMALLLSWFRNDTPIDEHESVRDQARTAGYALGMISRGLTMGAAAHPLFPVIWEERMAQDLDELRAELAIEPAREGPWSWYADPKLTAALAA